MVQAFTGAPALMEVEKGGRISLMNGYVTGGFIELVRLVLHSRTSCRLIKYTDLEIISTHLSLASLLWGIGKQHSPRCDAAERTSHLGLFCLLKEIS